MVTLCWAAKGGSGTTVITAALALCLPRHSLLVDLDGELPAVLGLAVPDRPGVDEWLRSSAPPDQLGELVIDVDPTTSLLPRHEGVEMARGAPIDESRWIEFAEWLRRQHHDGVEVFIDAGSVPPSPAMVASADQVLLVTRLCYLSLRRARAAPVRPTGVIVVEEAGRSLRSRDVEYSLGAPVVATVSVDPAIARAVDSGLLTNRLPRVIGRELRRVPA